MCPCAEFAKVKLRICFLPQFHLQLRLFSGFLALYPPNKRWRTKQLHVCKYLLHFLYLFKIPATKNSSCCQMRKHIFVTLPATRFLINQLCDKNFPFPWVISNFHNVDQDYRLLWEDAASVDWKLVSCNLERVSASNISVAQEHCPENGSSKSLRTFVNKLPIFKALQLSQF